MRGVLYGSTLVVLSAVAACNPNQSEEATILPTAIRMQPHEVSVLDKGQSVTFSLLFTGPDARVVWWSSDGNVVRIDEHGIAKAAGAGQAWAFVRVLNAPSVRDSVQFTVRDNPTFSNLRQ